MIDNAFTIIGAGKIASSIISALIKNKCAIRCVISKKINSAKELAIKNKIKFYSNSLKDIPKEGMFILSTPDDQIDKTAKAISKLKLNFTQSIFIHLSGSLNITVLDSLMNKGANTASLHIMQTFPSKKIVQIKGSFAAIETEQTEILKYLFSLSRKLGLKPFRIHSENKIDYHIAAVYASNFLIANLFNSQKELMNANIDLPFKILKPIINTTLKNVDSFGIEKALSGPVERGDYNLVVKHVKRLEELNDKSLLFSYAAQSLVLLNIIKIKSGRHYPGHRKIKDLLMKTFKENIK